MSRGKLLFTGAGFTANFGAPLGFQMWNWIYGAQALQGQEALLEKMRVNERLGIEQIYFEVMNGAYSDAQKQAMSQAMLGAFRDMDRVLCFSMRNRMVNTTALDAFVASFAGQRRNPGYFFTLNQDIYIERWYANDERPLLPGLPPNRIWRNPLERETPLTDADYIVVPNEAEVEQHKARLGQHETFRYLKLHGSANWLRPGGQPQMVIGAQKEESIRAEPLLSWYMELFRAALHEPERLLLVIGYGFGDEHINAIIASAIENAGLKFVVVSPGPTTNLLRRFENDPHWRVLPRGLRSHVPYSLQQIFPSDMNVVLQDITSPGWLLLRRDFFDQPE